MVDYCVRIAMLAMQDEIDAWGFQRASKWWNGLSEGERKRRLDEAVKQADEHDKTLERKTL